MEDTEDLQAKIARLASRIDRHKAVENPSPYFHPYQYPSAPEYGQSYWAPQRGTPYGSRARGWRRAATHRNRTLVVGGQAQPHDTQGEQSAAPQNGASETAGATPPGWTSKWDRHKQLINNTVYEQKTQERAKAMEQTRLQKQHLREEREKARFNSHLHILASNPSHGSTTSGAIPAVNHIYINEIKFLVADGGSKLIKASDEANMLKSTPKWATIGGVSFLRSKHGNLYRAGFIKTKRRTDIKKILEPCKQFSSTGTCSKGPQCRYVHDAKKVAICREFLQTGECRAKDDCDLSHDPTPERVPACLHFVRGNCTNPACRYAHVRTNPGAPVCRAFAILGYCPKGAACPERHVHECPDYANKAICRTKNCRLPHVDRAGQLRKAAALHGDDAGDEAASDISSDDELAAYDSDDVDSDDFEEDYAMPDVASHELSQQVDFVKFG